MPVRSAKVIFMGSPEFAVSTLLSLVDAPDFDVVHVVTQPDRPKGRGKVFSPTPVKECAASHGIPVTSMSKTNYTEIVLELSQIAPDFIVVASFGIILKSDLLTLPKSGCINLHASLLPKYRGVSPIQAAILSGETKTGCTSMLMDEGVDTGDMLFAESVEIGREETAGELERKLAALGAPLILKTLRGILEGTVKPVEQDEEMATYTRKIKKEHGRIDWSKDTEAISRQIRAMSPWPTAYTLIADKRLIVLEAVPMPDIGGEPGVILSGDPLVVGTGRGGLEIRRVKIAGKKEMPAKAFVAGYRPKPGDRLG